MSITRIKSYGLSDGAVTTEKISNNVSLGVKISNIQIANSSYSVLDDTAIALEGGYLVITGAGFASGCQVIVGANTATSTTFVNSTTIRAQVGAADAGTKTVYVVNTDGGTAIRVNGLTYSATPTWVTGSTLTGAIVDESISIQLDASLATSYQLQTGSSLPAGLSLAANGLLTGTVTGIEEETTYSFTIEAIDAENQESPRSFSITITSGDEYFYATTLLLNGDGTNGANNNTFVDSSTNNFAITRNGNTTQGTFSPFSAPDGRWSAYFDGTGDFLSIANNTALDLGTGDYTIEGWWNFNDTSNQALVSKYTSTNGFVVQYHSGNLRMVLGRGSADSVYSFAWTPTVGVWYHIAITRSGTDGRAFINGVQIGSTQTFVTNNVGTTAALQIGSTQTVSELTRGYVSNFRLVKGTAVYTSAFTPSASPLTAITNTSLLTCQSNRFKDNSTNNFAITRNGDVKVTSFSPFAPTGSYSAATNGGSGYFDGTGDYLSVASATALNLATGAFTIETWVYLLGNGPFAYVASRRTEEAARGFVLYYDYSTKKFIFLAGDTDISAWEVNITSTNSYDIGQWVHVAVTRNSSNDFTIWVNGTSQATANSSVTIADDAGTLLIGAVDSNTNLHSGYFSNWRLVKGRAVYTSAFTPSTAPLGVTSGGQDPPQGSETSLLCNFTNGGIIDYTSKNNLETVGNAQISTSVKKYGTGSMYFDGTGDYLVSASSPTLALGSGDFTIESWVYVTAHTNADGCICLNWTGTWSANKWSLHTDHGSANEKFTFWVNNYNTGSPMLTSTTTVATGTWYHVAVTRSGSSWRLFVNGTQEGSTVTSSAAVDNGISWPIYVSGALAGQALNGYIDDLRITKGIARYTSNFTPPNSAHRLK